MCRQENNLCNIWYSLKDYHLWSWTLYSTQKLSMDIICNLNPNSYLVMSLQKKKKFIPEKYPRKYVSSITFIVLNWIGYFLDYVKVDMKAGI